MVPFNDANALEDLLKEKHNEIGTLMIEPILGNCCSISATQEYMEAVRELCTKYDIILIIDEVKTGFRVAKGGVQELYGVEADLCTFAKSIANGYPIAALCGKEEYMRNIKYGGVLHGGTFTAHSVAISAANKTLEILQTTDALETVANYGTKLKEGISEILTKRDIAHSFTGHPSMSGLFFSESPPRMREILDIPITHFMKNLLKKCLRMGYYANSILENHGSYVKPMLRMRLSRP